jgi:DNA-binding Lrp family transcriptional regulator
MELTRTDQALTFALLDGLPLVERPYAVIGDDIGLDEAAVIARIEALVAGGVIRRFGAIVRHRELGYRANGMVVWDVPDERVADVGRQMAELSFVTLCYRRPRRLPDWPYNLFCMIHGKAREDVLAQAEDTARHCGLLEAPREVLFSRRRFKQCGATYVRRQEAAA